MPWLGQLERSTTRSAHGKAHGSPARKPWIAGLAIVLACLGTRPASALDVYVNYGSGYVDVQDNVFPDADATVGIVQLLNLAVPGYMINGVVDGNVGPTLTSILGSSSAGLRLTNFTAEAVGVPLYPLHIGFKDQLSGTYTGVTGADVIDGFASNAFGSPVPVGTDELSFWQGYLDVQTMGTAFGGPVPGGNPLVPASSPPVPYPLYGHGPASLGGPFTNPVLGADLYLTLGANGDRFTLNSSAEVGIAVPEPASWLLLTLGGCAVLAARSRSRLAARSRGRRMR